MTNTDIIARLEQRYEQTAEPECDLIQEAALVIDRLRDELADVRADAALLRAEIELLRAALAELLSGHDNLYVAHFGPGSNPHDDIAAKPARRALEPKAMTDIVTRLRQVQGDNEDACEAAAEIERLRAAVPAEIAKGTYALAQEIIRLGAALRGVQESTDLDDAQGIARRALEPKP